MKQVFLERGRAVVKEVPSPQLSGQSVLVATSYSFISSGTEGAFLAATGRSLFGRFFDNARSNIEKIRSSVRENGFVGTYALISGMRHRLSEVGYSCSGKVIAIGDQVTTVRPGDYVACAGAGFAHHAEQVAIPENLVVKLAGPDHLAQASCSTIAAIALQGLRRADLRMGEVVAVIGLGLLGQLTVQLARQAGLTVVAVDIDESRVMLAKEFGAQYGFNPLKTTFTQDLAFLTEHTGVDATIITASGSTGALIENAIEITRRKGKVVLVGDVKLDFARDQFYAKELDLLISTSYGPGRYDQLYERDGASYPRAYVRWTERDNIHYCASLIEAGALKIDPLLSAQYPVEEAEKAYGLLESKKALGIVLSYSSQEAQKVQPGTILPARLAAKKKIDNVRVGFIGVGGFAKVKLLPLFASQQAVKIGGIVEINAAAAQNVARQYDVTLVESDYKKFLTETDCNAVVIATPHGMHARQVIDALKAGKQVFVEKPLAVMLEECDELEKVLYTTSDALCVVDFNRSMAPFVERAKKEIAQRSGPVLLTYRMNAGFLPRDHWIQQPEHRGRVIGELCHIVDLAQHLIERKPLSLSVETASGSRRDYLPSDNVVATIGFDDGSVAQLMYTAYGSPALSKERMELFWDGKSIVMDDYKTLQILNGSRVQSLTAREADKGHSAVVASFIEAVKKEELTPPVNYKRLLLTSRLTILIHEFAQQGGGRIVLE